MRKDETAGFHPVSSMFYISHSKKRFSMSNAQRMPEISRIRGKKFNYCIAPNDQMGEYVIALEREKELLSSSISAK